MVEPDRINVSLAAVVGIVCAVLTIATILSVTAVYNDFMERETARKVINMPTATSDSRIAEQKAALMRYGWLDRDAGRVAIPIDLAMELVVRDLQGESKSDPEQITVNVTEVE